ncbi:hypothetical protein OA2633_11395 [Oceanicaulis alexandrii HTCC2633]|uniref:hypothetical protein n=1 Tax=Oceanicaulis sp. HTCC2633 TaxID=314254 RepID=UPI0000668C28|nr:hypothetical protein [Oceanicaulis sp. HTCC2633]EAP90302.1 hypothetical protein OA2633_11395 [Oceanicaulis alexandrii HTCC2633] [Oceanicaulis sp. HTCC2633]
MTDQVDISHWRMIVKSLGKALQDRKVELSEDDLAYVARFFLEHLESRSLHVVPATPSKRMLEASMNALSASNRPTVRNIGTKRKHRWRLAASLKAAPSWREGARAEGYMPLSPSAAAD